MHTLVWDKDDYLIDYYSGNTYRYNVVGGEVISEDVNGTHVLYTPDPLGSMVALIDSSQSIIDTYDYWPYGVVRVRGGVGHNPFQFVGSLGYYQHAASSVYVRARTLRVDVGRWQTEDPIGFAGGDWNLYGYVGNRPISMSDPSGKLPVIPIGACIANPACRKVLTCIGEAGFAALINLLNQLISGVGKKPLDSNKLICASLCGCLMSVAGSQEFLKWLAAMLKNPKFKALASGPGCTALCEGLLNSADCYPPNPPVGGGTDGGCVKKCP
jgi:RHS repeat-associated protein